MHRSISAGFCSRQGAGSTCTAAVNYLRGENFNGLDAFSFKANDGLVDYNLADMRITVTPANDVPNARGAAVSTAEDSTVMIILDGNDIDSPNLAFTAISGPGNGTLGSISTPNCTANGSGSRCTATVTYTPAENYNGPDSFSFKVNDGNLDSNAAVVSIAVNAVSDAPVARRDFYNTSEENALNQELTGPRSHMTGSGRLRVLTVRHDAFFSRSGLYQEAGHDYPDNLERFAFFCRAVMELLVHFGEKDGWQADLLHVHDWQAALCAVYLRTLYQANSALSKIRSVLTIHNLGYQGLFPAEHSSLTGLPAHLFTPAALEFYGKLNLLKGGLVFAGLLTTVGPTYSGEIQTPPWR